jgi:outer membrane autotransporter protein
VLLASMAAAASGLATAQQGTAVCTLALQVTPGGAGELPLGTKFTLTARVTPDATAPAGAGQTGTVSFSRDGTPIGDASLANASSSLSDTPATTGIHVYTATAAADLCSRVTTTVTREVCTCTALSDSASISALPPAQVAGPNTACQNYKLPPGYAFWSTTLPSCSSQTATEISYAKATLTSASANVNVNAPPACTILATPAGITRPGQEVTLTASCTNNPTSYLWSTGQTGRSIAVNPPRDVTYTLTASNGIGSSAKAAYTVQRQVSVAALAKSAYALSAPQLMLALDAVRSEMRELRLRLDDRRVGGNAVPAQSLRLALNDPAGASATVATPAIAAPYAAASADEPGERFGFFANGTVGSSTQDAVDTLPGFRIRSSTLTVGGDYRYSGNNVVGVAVGFFDGKASLDSAAGSQTGKGTSLSLFGSFAPTEQTYVGLIAHFGQTRYNSRRIGSFAGDEGTEYAAATHGRQWSIAADAGYDFSRGALSLSPYARAEYVSVKVDGFAETGPGLMALALGDQNVDNTFLTLGGRLSYALSQPWGVMVPFARLEWQHRAQFSPKDAQAQLADLPAVAVSVPYLGLARNLGEGTIGATFVFPRGLTGLAQYVRTFGSSSYSGDRFELGLRVAF